MKNINIVIENSFSFLENFGFTIFFPQPEIGESVIAGFSSQLFNMRLVQYHQELFLEFTKKAVVKYSDENEWITFHWIIEYLSGINMYKTKFYKNENNYDERIKKQILSIAEELSMYIHRIVDFFNSKNYEEQNSKLRDYINKRLKECGLI